MQLIRVKQIVKMWLSWMNWWIQDFQMPHQVTSSPMERLMALGNPFSSMMEKYILIYFFATVTQTNLLAESYMLGESLTTEYLHLPSLSL